jgi:hypothetical protein
MGVIHEETSHEFLGVSFTVDEREKGSCREPWRFVSLEIDCMESLTPKELRELGKWLVSQGKRLGREYKSNGTPRAMANSEFKLTASNESAT